MLSLIKLVVYWMQGKLTLVLAVTLGLAVIIGGVLFFGTLPSAGDPSLGPEDYVTPDWMLEEEEKQGQEDTVEEQPEDQKEPDQPEMVVIPSIEGMTGSAARDLIESLGLSVVLEYENEDCRRKEGEGNFEARYTRPPEGTSVESGTPIGLYVCWVNTGSFTGNPQVLMEGVQSNIPDAMELVYEGSQELSHKGEDIWDYDIQYSLGDETCVLGVYALVRVYETAETASQSYKTPPPYQEYETVTLSSVGEGAEYYYWKDDCIEYMAQQDGVPMQFMTLVMQRRNVTSYINLQVPQSMSREEMLSISSGIAERIDDNILKLIEY